MPKSPRILLPEERKAIGASTACLSRGKRRQAVSRSSVYYLPRPASAADLAIMWRMGSRRSIAAPRTTKPQWGHKIYR